MRNDLRIRAGRFVFSGLLATGVHVTVAATLLQAAIAAPPAANGAAFMVATVFSYVVNTRWSFASRLRTRNFFRFAVVAGLGLTLSVTLAAAAETAGWHHFAGIALVVAAVPPVTFLLHNAWTYR